MYTCIGLYLIICNIIYSYSQTQTGNSQNHDIKGNLTDNFIGGTLRCSITSPHKQYISGDSIPVNIVIRNTGYYPITLYLHKNFHKNLRIVLRDENGVNLPTKDITISDTDGQRDIFFKDYTGNATHTRFIILKKGEVFQKTIDLKNYMFVSKYHEQTRRITISAFFYPNPQQMPHFFISSNNRYTVSILTQHNTRKQLSGLSVTTQDIGITPEEIVYLMLSAEYRKSWPHYLKYIALPDFIKSYPDFHRIYVQSNNKEAVIHKFQHFLTNQTNKHLIHFKILSISNILRENSPVVQVKVHLTREINHYPKNFEYTYYLTRLKSLWSVIGLDSTILR